MTGTRGPARSMGRRRRGRVATAPDAVNSCGPARVRARGRSDREDAAHRTSSMRSSVLLAGLAVLAARMSHAATGDVTVTGEDGASRVLTLAALRALPPVEITLAGRDGDARLAGPILWRVAGAGAGADADPHAVAHEVVRVTGADGYAAPVAMAEIAPAFEGKPVILAVTRNGAPLARPLLVVPGDHLHGRDVRDVVAIVVGR